MKCGGAKSDTPWQENAQPDAAIALIAEGCYD